MKWTPEAKLKAVVDTTNLVDIDLGHYLRKEGLYSTQVTEWRSDILHKLSVKPGLQLPPSLSNATLTRHLS